MSEVFPLKHWRLVFLAWSGLALIGLVFCEFGARLDDWFFDGISLSANPTYESLFRVDAQGVKTGITGARWKKVIINNVGMRGPDVPEKPRQGCQRWLFLGASETFGEPSLADAEYPAQLRSLLSTQVCVDIMNSALPGIAPRELLRYYQGALRQYESTVVFIYPSTHFYLAESAPKQDASNLQGTATAQNSWHVLDLPKKSRFLERLKDSAEYPMFVQKQRVRVQIDTAIKDRPSNWILENVPKERLDSFEADMRALVAAIRGSGAEPVLITHAVRATSPPRSEDMHDLFAMRAYVPRASEKVIAEFEYAAAQRLREMATSHGVRLIDLSAAFGGQRELFIDLVHFSSGGHRRVAEFIYEQMALQGHSHAL